MATPVPLTRFETYLIRPAYVFVVFVVVLLGLVQLAGRIGVSVVHLFESEANALLAHRRVQLSGLQGAWRGLNPVFRVAYVNLPAGMLTNVEVELDVLESAFRSALIPRRLRIGDVELNLAKTAEGWRLLGMEPAGTSYDPMPALRHGDELDARGVFNFVDGSHIARVRGAATLVNRGGRHYAVVELENLAPGVGVGDGRESPVNGVRLQWWQREAVPFVADAENTLVLGGEMVVPSVLTGMGDVRVAFSDGIWRDQSQQGRGSVAVSLSGLRAPRTDVALGIQFTLEGQRRERKVTAVIPDLVLDTGDETVTLDETYLALQLPEPEPSPIALAEEILGDSGPPQPMLRVWRERLDPAQLSGFFTRHFGDLEPVGRWVEALALEGRITNVHGFFDPEMGSGFGASLAGINTQAYKGAPMVANGQGQIWGYRRGAALQLNASNLTLQFPDLFHERWEVEHVQGLVKAWFGGGDFALRGSHIRAHLGESLATAGFAVIRPDASGPDARYEQRLSLNVHIDQVGLQRARAFVPYKIPQGLADWVAAGPRSGVLSNVDFIYHGQVHLRPGELARRIELMTDVADARIAYHPEWPEVDQLDGRLHAAGVRTSVHVNRARTSNASITNSTLVLHDNGRYAALQFYADVAGDDVLGFIRDSPLRQTLGFITPDWESSGNLALAGDLTVPIRIDDAPDLRADLNFEAKGFDLAMPQFRTVFKDLRGRGSFGLPHHLKGEFEGRLFDREASVAVDYEEDWLRFDIHGRATPADVYELINVRDVGVLDGEFDFTSQLSLAMGGGNVTSLSATADLAGLRVALPGHFAKTAEDVTPSEVDIQFLEDYRSVRWQYKDTRGWLHVDDDIERGAIGISAPPPMIDESESTVVISGKLDQAVLSEWVADGGESQVALPVDWTIRDLEINRFVIGDVDFADLVVQGEQRGGSVQFQFAGETLNGVVTLPRDQMMTLALEYVRLPVSDPTSTDVLDEASANDSVDPLTVSIGRSLPAAKVEIARLDLGPKPFGSWQFVIRPQDDAVVFSPFAADVNGVHMSEAAITWDLERNTSAFAGKITLDDLQTTLPQWGYAPSLHTSKARLTVDGNWQGSPVNVSLLGMQGNLAFVARDGRFFDLESQGGLKMLSLLNFSNIAKRISFDFSDVTEEGISFNKIDAQLKLNRGALRFVEPMVIESSSSNFQIGGLVDMRSGELRNEMIVTLPVSNSLPWYGVYLALVNPLAGLGVIVGERVLRKPIDAFSTAKFNVTGTLEEPKVTFVGLWNKSIDPLPEEVEKESAVSAREPTGASGNASNAD